MMVRIPSDYLYSSYSVYISEEPEKHVIEGLMPIVDTEKVLGAFHHNAREQYRMFVEDKISHAEQEMLIQKDRVIRKFDG